MYILRSLAQRLALVIPAEVEGHREGGHQGEGCRLGHGRIFSDLFKVQCVKYGKNVRDIRGLWCWEGGKARAFDCDGVVYIWR